MRASEAFEQGNGVPRTRCQEGRCGSSLSRVVSFKQNYFKALMTNNMWMRKGREGNQSEGCGAGLPGLTRSGWSGWGQEDGRSQLGLRGPRGSKSTLK